MEEKVVLVTGASRGIGNNTARVLAKKGYKIIANYNRSEEAALKLQEDLKKENINIDIYKADVSKRAEVQEMIQFILSKYKKIDVLINNAGISQTKLFTEITDFDWENMINTNLSSVFYVSQEVARNMIQNKKGLIINISSIWGVTGASCESHYAVSKAGVDALTKSLAKELGPSNIRVNSIAPGIINTDMNAFLEKSEKEALKDEIPLEKIGEPRDISRCIEWLIEDEYVTGQIISVNGGWLI